MLTGLRLQSTTTSRPSRSDSSQKFTSPDTIVRGPPSSSGEAGPRSTFSTYRLSASGCRAICRAKDAGKANSE